LAEVLMMQAIGLGLIVSIIFSETLGVAAGGMVVPGYMAMMIHEPMRIAGTIIVSLMTYYTIKILSNYAFIYGKRRTVLVILFGFFFGWVSRQLFMFNLPNGTAVELQAVGFIIPGLIANWMERQGVIQTLSAMVVAAVLVRLLLMIFTGGQVLT
jgi:poly-gamma-glutamate biosynthesis protein PgsC/CapC